VDSVGTIEHQLAALMDALHREKKPAGLDSASRPRAALQENVRPPSEYVAATPRLRSKWTHMLGSGSGGGSGGGSGSGSAAGRVSRGSGAFEKVLLGWEVQRDAARELLERHAAWLRSFRSQVSAAAVTDDDGRPVVVPLGGGREMAITIRGKQAWA
jgi:hypothetical protein